MTGAEQVPEVHSLDSFVVALRGTVHIIEAPWPVPPLGKVDWRDRELIIDGERHRVRGVERDCTMRTLPVGTRVGVLI